jgi:hypothetical protein
MIGSTFSLHISFVNEDETAQRAKKKQNQRAQNARRQRNNASNCGIESRYPKIRR